MASPRVHGSVRKLCALVSNGECLKLNTDQSIGSPYYVVTGPMLATLHLQQMSSRQGSGFRSLYPNPGWLPYIMIVDMMHDELQGEVLLNAIVSLRSPTHPVTRPIVRKSILPRTGVTQ